MLWKPWHQPPRPVASGNSCNCDIESVDYEVVGIDTLTVSQLHEANGCLEFVLFVADWCIVPAVVMKSLL